ILGRPGHARKAQAICSWLNRDFGAGSLVAWAKQDPTRTDIEVPANVREAWPRYKAIFDRYGKETYALYRPTSDHEGTEAAVTAFLDLLFVEERGQQLIAASTDNYQSIRSLWFEYLMPNLERSQVAELLTTRRYVIIQGPPGTGKTMMATDLLREE